ncbi:MAG: hypothetical protein IKV87_01210 [Methanobrevibacter sp.]|nr:hypothetical protein [Methanobrevibacter sp.]
MSFFDKVKKAFKSSENNLKKDNDDLVDIDGAEVEGSDSSLDYDSADDAVYPEDNEDSELESADSKNVLFLCATNTMISPVAEAVFKDKIGINNVFSAGLFAPDDGDVSPEAIKICSKYGIELSKRKVTHIKEIPMEDMDLIITFKEYHNDKLKAEYPNLKIFTYLECCSHFSNSSSSAASCDYDDDLNIPDCFGGNFKSFESCFDGFVSELKINDSFRDELSPDEKFINFTFLDSYVHGDANELIMDSDAINVNQYDLTVNIDRDDLTIDGQGHAMDALGKDRIFIISGNNITLRNITFKNGFSTMNGYYTADGGAIYIMEGSVTIENCTFINNHSLNGGAINCGNSSRVLLRGCRFIDNSSTGFGGAIRGDFNNENLIVENCQFISNSSEIGGATFNGSYRKCDFIDNRATKYGGASSNGTFVKCNFNDNYARESGGACDGVSAEECEFIGNSSGDYGGASSGGNYKGCSFKGNSSNYGGAFTEGGLLEDCKFIDNSARIEGHAIYTEDDLKISGSCFKDSLSDRESGLICYNGKDNDNLNIKNSRFSSGLSRLIDIKKGYSYLYMLKIESKNEYAVFNQNGTVEIHKPKFNNANKVYNNHSLYISSKEFEEIPIEEGPDSEIFPLDKEVSPTFKGFDYLEKLIERQAPMVNLKEDIVLNELEQRFYEGGIELDHDYLEIEGNNHIIDANELSRIFLITGKRIVLKNITFKNGKDFYDEFSMSAGGAIYTFKDTDLTIINCKFINNISKNSVGAIASRGKSLKINDSLFLGNHAYGSSAGAIYNEDGSFEVRGCEFRDNSAARFNGVGAIHIKDGELICIDTLFINNESKEYSAGAIRLDSGNSFFKGCFFNNNRSEKEGGAIYSQSELTIEECRFEGNNSLTSRGGAICSSSLDVSGSQFIENSSEYGGGAIETKDLLMVDCSFERNSSKNSGGAIDVMADELELRDINFIGNHAGDFGGAIVHRGTLRLKKVLFDGNSSDYSGGAIENTGELHVEECRFIDNHSKNSAGAISNLGEANIYNSKFINNSSDGKGGALGLTGEYVSRIDSCEFVDNYADVDSVVYARDNEVEFVDCKFEGNSA